MLIKLPCLNKTSLSSSLFPPPPSLSHLKMSMIRRCTWLFIYFLKTTVYLFIYLIPPLLSSFFVTVIKCPSLGTPDNAVKTGYQCNAPTASYGTACFCSCKPGYESINGSAQRTCQENQQWSGTPLQCKGNAHNFRH